MGPLITAFNTPQRGFTLLELLIVLVVIGIGATLLTVKAIPDNQRLLMTEAERLAQLLQVAKDDATLKSRPVYWVPDATGYRFLEPVDNELQLVTDEDLLRPRRWNLSPINTTILIDGQPARQLPILPEGLARAVTIQLSSGQSAVMLQQTASGRFTYQRMNARAGLQAQ